MNKVTSQRILPPANGSKKRPTLKANEASKPTFVHVQTDVSVAKPNHVSATGSATKKSTDGQTRKREPQPQEQLRQKRSISTSVSNRKEGYPQRPVKGVKLRMDSNVNPGNRGSPSVNGSVKMSTREEADFFNEPRQKKQQTMGSGSSRESRATHMESQVQDNTEEEHGPGSLAEASTSSTLPTTSTVRFLWRRTLPTRTGTVFLRAPFAKVRRLSLHFTGHCNFSSLYWCL